MMTIYDDIYKKKQGPRAHLAYVKQVINMELDLSLRDLRELPLYVPEYVIELDCAYNKISCLPKKYVMLEILWCSHNQLTTIPDTYVKLNNLICNDNNLIRIPSTLVSLRTLDCDNNEDLEVPWLPNLKHLSCDSCPKFQELGITDITSYRTYVKEMTLLAIMQGYDISKKSVLRNVNKDTLRLLKDFL
jgi:hypothetical protein